MSLSPLFLSRLLTVRVPLGVPALSWEVESISDRGVGGCYRAVLTATADPVLLVQFLQLLRAGIELRDEQGELVWWGYLHEATVEFEGSEIGASLDGVGNKVKARYRTIAPGDTTASEAVTEWATDDFSIEEYGTIEKIVEIENVVSAEAAEANRDRALAAASMPVSVPDFAGASTQRKGVLTLTCLGWWWTLLWRSYGRAEGRISHITEGEVYQGIGQDEYANDTIHFEDTPDGDAIFDDAQSLYYVPGLTIITDGATEPDNNGTFEIIDVVPGVPGNQKIYIGNSDLDDENAGNVISIIPFGVIGAQSFTTPAGGFSLGTMGVRVGKVGNPLDNFRLAIYSDSSGSPGSSLTNATIAGTVLSHEVVWRGLDLAAPYTLTGSTTYWLHADRTGGYDAENYYIVELDGGAGYSGGSYKFYQDFGMAIGWNTRVVSMPFDLLEKKETTQLIKDILAEIGEFFPEVIVETASGVFSTILQLDDAEAMSLIEELMAAGTTNQRRLFASISPERVLTIYEEPAGDAQGYIRSADGSIRDQYGALVAAARVKAGRWMAAEAVLQHVPKGSQTYEAARAMIDEVEYRPGRGELRVVPRGRVSPWEV